MNHGGFLDTPRSSPLSLGVVIGLHAVALAALILAKGPVFTPREPPIMVRNYPPEMPPPDPVEQKEAKAPAKQSLPVPTPLPFPIPEDTLVKIPQTPPFPVGEGVLPPIESGGGGVTITSPAPVLVDARLDPRFAGALQPPYPTALMREGIEGVATVRVLVGVDGRVKRVELVAADRPAFFEATEKQAMRRWRFMPATRDGVAIESWKRLTVRFTMPG